MQARHMQRAGSCTAIVAKKEAMVMHLVVLQHGMWGTAQDMVCSYIAAVRRTCDSSLSYVHNQALPMAAGICG